MKNLLFSTLKNAMNAYLNLDPESKKRLQKLQGKSITIHLLPFHFIFQLFFSKDGVEINEDELRAAETKITGTPLQMLGVMVSKENRHRFFSEDIKIEGDAEFAHLVTALFDHLEIDWEEYLSHFIGDAPAYQTRRFAQGIAKQLYQMEERFSQNVNEYLHEEKAWLPAREALHDFFADIDLLRMDVDRIEAKIKQLESSILHKEKP